METWFWIVGWFLSFQTIIRNGFTIFLVCSRRNLRTETNAFIVSLAVADFCVGLSVIPSLFFCDITNTCYWSQHLLSWSSWVNIIRWLLSNKSVVNLCVLVLDRFIAISARTLAKKLRFNHQMSLKILHDRSAVIMMGLLIGVFLVCYGMHLRRCSSIGHVEFPTFQPEFLFRRNLHTKTNSFIVSLAVADFCVGLSIIPSLFVCDVTKTCDWPQAFPSWKDVVRWLFSYLSVLNLCSLVLDRYIAILKPFKYITFMTRSRVIQVITSCWIASFTLVALKTALRLCCETPLTSIVAVVVLMISMEIFPCVLQILCFVSMLIHVWKQDRSARTLGRISFKTRNEKSAVIMMGIVIGVFVVCYGIYLRCSLVVLSDTNASCKDEQYKIPVLVLNSAINPLSYAFFKRDIKKEFKRLISQVV
ncbi:unnamed protein product [Porites lobata]|uniref:G-protein coupled receptors family 1 profile domain-containing protein n=1 Tax=Porites lobata TaxID=104759 RepID=A0ABN8RPD7_9CNID|nr:unnamed protein product [Porites lobata]